MIDSSTALYGVFGNPIGHSKSPLIHNFLFQYHHINAVYLAFKPDSIANAVDSIKSLHLKGASITLPFKEVVMEFLDGVDDDAKSIGAVNTIVNREGVLWGYNTDYMAAVEPLSPFHIAEKRVCIIGAGGAAQAIAYGIYKRKGRLTIVNKSKNKGEYLAKKYDAAFYLLEDTLGLAQIRPDILINTTPVGMYPKISEQSFPAEFINNNTIVMDIVYNPIKTKLLSEAQSIGCRVIDGLSMFLYQGARQFELWTGIRPDIEMMRQAVLKSID